MIVEKNDHGHRQPLKDHASCIWNTNREMIAEARLFVRLGLLSFIGMAFYYAHLFFGILDNEVMFKALAITFFLAAIPLPILAVNNNKLFPELPRSGKTVLNFASLMLLFHHFVMTFIFVMFLQA